MIIGKYSVNPLEVLYGCKSFDPETAHYSVSVNVSTGGMIMPLSQSAANAEEADKWMKLIDKCIIQRVEVMRENALLGLDDDEDEGDNGLNP